MEFLRYLESLRTPFFNALFSLITNLGSEMVFMVFGLLIFWCFNKKWGFRYFVIGLTGNVINQFLKAIFLVPRPWVADKSFNIVESARADATGYSFPSGHTQSVVNVFGTIMAWMRKNWVSALCIAAITLTAFSRMYLGVHTLLDVSVSLVTGIVIVAVLVRLFNRYEGSRHAIYAIGLSSVLACISLVLYLFLAPVREGNVAQFDVDGKKAACTVLGSLLGFIMAWWVDDRYTHFDVKAVWWAQAFKFVIGLGLIMGVRLGFKPILNAVFGESPFTDGIRYFLMSVVGGVLWPMTFRLWGKLGRIKTKASENLPLT